MEGKTRTDMATEVKGQPTGTELMRWQPSVSLSSDIGPLVLFPFWFLMPKKRKKALMHIDKPA